MPQGQQWIDIRVDLNNEWRTPNHLQNPDKYVKPYRSQPLFKYGPKM